MARLFAAEKVTLRNLVPQVVDQRAARKLQAIFRKAQSNLDEKGLHTMFLAFGMASWPVKQQANSRRFGEKSDARSPKEFQGAGPMDEGGPPEIAQRAFDFAREVSAHGESVEADGGEADTEAVVPGEDKKLADPKRPPRSPIVLLPVTCSVRGGDFEAATIESVGPPQINMVLAHVLRESFDGLDLNEEDVLEAGRLNDDAFSPFRVLERMRELTAECDGLEVMDQAFLGNFSFQKLAMVHDLKTQVPNLLAHDMIAALAGDIAARAALGGRHVSVEPSALDKVAAENEFIVLDADSSQQVVIHSVAGDVDGVIQGPPGCGKSQTIANIISTLVAQGKRVLFVAEKRAALEAVYKRLEQTGLSHIALDLHGAGISQKAVMGKVSSTLQKIRNAVDPDYHGLHAKFEDRRKRVIHHVQSLHQPLRASGLSPYEMQVGLIDTMHSAPSRTRWRGTDLENLTKTAVANVEDLLREARGLASLVDRTDPSPWTHSSLADGQHVQLALDAALRLSSQRLPHFRDRLMHLVSTTGLPTPNTLGDAEQTMNLIADTNKFLESWKLDMFACAGEAMKALAPAERGEVATLWATLTDRRFRSARRQVAALSRTNKLDPASLLGAAAKAEAIADRWQQLCGPTCVPVEAPVVQEAMAALQEVATDLFVLTQAVPGIGNLSVDQLVQVSSMLAADDIAAHQIPAVRQIESQIEQLGAAAILAEIRTDKVHPDKWVTLFKHAYYASCYDAARAASPALGAFRGESHDQFAREFRSLDQDRLKLAASRVSRKHAERAIEAMNTHKEQMLLVRAEAEKRARHMPLRKLISKAPDVLIATCPCWMSSPLNVSQLIPGDRQYFDVVVFDEASQVLPEDAVCAVLRGRRLVVAGDQHQLPPTTFFADGGVDGEDESAISGFDSLLNQLGSFVDHWPLEWHYRSRDERLIAFSNRHVYGDSLTTFPGVGDVNSVSHVFVEAPSQDGDEQSNSAEVQRVVEIVFEHATKQLAKDEAEWESLGVITMGIKHSDRVQAALDQARKGRHDLDRYFDSKLGEAFFVKNIERVQGDERDHILISLGYSRGRQGKFNHGLLGPINGAGGYRRLNVAVSRARRSMTLVSSITYRDVRIIDPAPSPGHKDYGVHLFRLLLEYAESGGSILGDTGGSGHQMNAFEADVFNALSSRGVPLIPQYGASGYRLDFAAKHPERAGELVLAIECDGASYHSAPTARDRDRLRQQQLTSIGWRFHRIWSTDWFQRREQQIESAVRAWEEAVHIADDAFARRTQLSTRPGDLFHDGDEHQLSADEPLTEPSAQVRTEPCPHISSEAELVDIVRWIQSDGLLRTDEEIVRDVLPRIGYQRKGPRIEKLILEAIRKAKSGA